MSLDTPDLAEVRFVEITDQSDKEPWFVMAFPSRMTAPQVEEIRDMLRRWSEPSGTCMSCLGKVAFADMHAGHKPECPHPSGASIVFGAP